MTEISTISGDICSPAAGKQFMDAVVGAAHGTAATCEQARANLAGEGVTGAPIDLLAAMQAAAADFAAACQGRSERFAGHMATLQDTVGADPTIAGTQQGRYLDPTKQ